MHRLAKLTLLAAAIPFTASADQPRSYVGVVLPSYHFEKGPATLNNDTFGLSFGRRFPLSGGTHEYFLEAGIFENSYEETSPFLIGGITGEIAEVGPGQVRLGAFGGIARYEELGKFLNEKYGLPSVNGFIPIVGLAAAYRTGDHELRLTTVPAGSEVRAIFNLSYTYAF